MTQRRTNAGFSLIELMVSASILIIVLVYLTQAFTIQQKTYIVVDQVTESQQNLRAVADLIERDVRRAGYLVPPHAAVCGYDGITAPDTLFVSDADAIRSVFGLEDEDYNLVKGGFGAEIQGLGATSVVTGTSANLVLDQLWLDIAADGDDFNVGAGVIVVNKNEEASRVACGIIEAVNTTTDTITVSFNGTTTGAVGTNADVVAVPAHVYRLTPATATTPSILTRDGTTLATDVEDLQVTYFIDLDDDLIQDAGERFGAAGTTANPFAIAAPGNPDLSMLREVQLNLVTVTRDDDPNTDFDEGAGQITGNRTTGLSGGDGKRRRVHSAGVRVRNNG